MSDNEPCRPDSDGPYLERLRAHVETLTQKSKRALKKEIRDNAKYFGVSKKSLKKLAKKRRHRDD